METSAQGRWGLMGRLRGSALRMLLMDVVPMSINHLRADLIVLIILAVINMLMESFLIITLIICEDIAQVSLYGSEW